MSLNTAQKVTCNILFHKSYKSFQVFTSRDGLYLSRNNIKTIYICILFHIAQCFTGSKSFKLPSLILKMLCKTKHTLHPFTWWMTIPLITTSEKRTLYITVCVNSTLNLTGLVLVLDTGIYRVLSEAFFSYSYTQIKHDPHFHAKIMWKSTCTKSYQTCVFLFFWDNITGTGLCQL